MVSRDCFVALPRSVMGVSVVVVAGVLCGFITKPDFEVFTYIMLKVDEDKSQRLLWCPKI